MRLPWDPSFFQDVRIDLLPCKLLKFKVLQNKPDTDTRKNNSLCEKANVPKGRGAKLPV